MKTIPSSVMSLSSAVAEAQTDRELSQTLIEVLLAKGADINLPSPTGYTPLDEAVLFGDPKMVAFLLGKGADPAVTIQSIPNESRWRSSMDGLNARQYAAWLRDRRRDMADAEIIALLDNVSLPKK